MAKTVRYDGKKRAQEIADTVYQDIAGQTYHRRKITNRVLADAEEVSTAINANRLRMAAIGREIDRLFDDHEATRETLDDAIDRLNAELADRRATQLELTYRQAAILLVDDAGDQIDVDVLKEHVDFDDVVQFIRDMVVSEDEPDPTPPAA